MTNSLTQEKVIPFTAEKKVKWLPISEEIVAFKEDILFNNELFSSKEGLALLSDVENAHHLNEIPHLKKQINGRNSEFGLFKKSFLEFIRSNPLNVNKNAELGFDMLIDKPFSYLQTHSVEDITILFVDYGDNSVYDVNAKLQPQGIYFGYISQHIDNYHYNLEKLLSAIKERSDIEIMKAPHSTIYGEGFIKKIPSYNSEPDRNLWIEFIWSPSDADFEKIKVDLDDRYNRYELIVSKIFGIEKIKTY